MSYILDALRKAERDRNLGRTPSLEDVTHAPPGTAAPARSRRLFALLSLIGGLLLLAVILRPATPESDGVEVSAVAPVQVLAPSVPAPVAPPGPAQPVEPAADPEPAVTALEEASPVESLDELMDAEPEIAEEPELPVQELEGVATPVATPVADPAPAAAVGLPPPAAESPGQTAGFKLLREMPSDYRAAFATLRVDVHVYDADPTRRWALINGKKQLEGSTLPEGPRIIEILPEGIAFDYRGQTALFPLNR